MENKASKLEEIMGERQAKEERRIEAAMKAEREAEKKRDRQHRLYVRKEFNRLFKRFKTLVEGHWDRYGWGWKFQFRGKEYWISYDSWFSPKTPGDPDDYDSRGHHWVLKSHFNFSYPDKGAFAIGDGDADDHREPKDYTERALAGLDELTKRRLY